jgi:RimJ/RimL family protein N-acetyltransferase
MPMVTLADLYPAVGLRLVAGPIELRGINDDDLVALCELALGGIHPPDEMPFLFPWTDVPRDQLARNTAQYHWRARASFSPASWELLLGVWHDGTLVGTQGLATHNFLVTRTGETGSWLGRAFQGRGIGTAMRRAVCAFAFDHLDAVEVTSGAFLDNPASLSVSRKVGYLPNGIQRVQRRDGELALKQGLVVTPDSFVRGPHELIADGITDFRRAIGLDSELGTVSNRP